jgi:hypothetical protein
LPAARSDAGCDWLQRRLRERMRRSRRSAGAGLARDFADTVQLIGHRKGDAQAAEPRLFRDALFEVLESTDAGLQRRLAAIAGPDDEKNVHKARIQIKRLRYLVEPLRTELPEARPVVRQLKELQTLLGELHDMHVLENELATAVEEAATEKARRLHRLALEGDEKSLQREQRRDQSPGLVMLAARARECRNDLHRQFDGKWLTHRHPGLRRDLERLRARISQ